MSKVDYTTMTNQALKRYMLDNRDDQQAFYAYMDRRYARPNQKVISPNDPHWEIKVLDCIKAQLNQT